MTYGFGQRPLGGSFIFPKFSHRSHYVRKTTIPVFKKLANGNGPRRFPKWALDTSWGANVELQPGRGPVFEKNWDFWSRGIEKSSNYMILLKHILSKPTITRKPLKLGISDRIVFWSVFQEATCVKFSSQSENIFFVYRILNWELNEKWPKMCQSRGHFSFQWLDSLTALHWVSRETKVRFGIYVKFAVDWHVSNRKSPGKNLKTFFEKKLIQP